MHSDLLLCYYGDDFTGSTDALEFLTRAGAKTMLFMEPPTAIELSQYPGLQAVGVAGMTRSLPTEVIEPVLTPALLALKELGAPHVHYKVCSTFDSSPEIGSIGRAIDVGTKIFGREFVPLLVGAPALGRYCVFGNLFARFGSAGEIYRLDRHPSMRCHPITPADEGNLKIHLAKQTKRNIVIFDILKVGLPFSQTQMALEEILNGGAEIVLFDVLSSDHLGGIGALVDEYANREKPLFSVGSSAIEMALGLNWEAAGQLKKIESWPDPGPAAPLLVASGSCSPVTEQQIVWALGHGFEEIALNPSGPNDYREIVGLAVDAAIAHLKAGRNVVLHTREKTQIPREPISPQEINRVEIFVKPKEMTNPELPALALISAVREIISKVKLKRMCVAGGDTSGTIVNGLGIEALEMIAPLAPGAPLCRAHAPGLPADGLEIVLKGGQVGNKDFFGAVLRGSI